MVEKRRCAPCDCLAPARDRASPYATGASACEKDPAAEPIAEAMIEGMLRIGGHYRLRWPRTVSCKQVRAL